MFLIAFENNVFQLPKQYLSENVDDWKEDEMDSTYIISEKSDELLPSIKRKKRKTEYEKVFEKVLQRCSKKNILLMSLMNLFLKQKGT